VNLTSAAFPKRVAERKWTNASTEKSTLFVTSGYISLANIETGAGANRADAEVVELTVLVAGASGLTVGFATGLGVVLILVAGFAGALGAGGPATGAGALTIGFGGAGLGGAGLAGAGLGGKGLGGLFTTFEVTVDFTQIVSASASFSDPCENEAAPPAEHAQVGVGA
jgi:hypothetical protein